MLGWLLNMFTCVFGKCCHSLLLCDCQTQKYLPFMQYTALLYMRYSIFLISTNLLCINYLFSFLSSLNLFFVCFSLVLSAYLLFVCLPLHLFNHPVCLFLLHKVHLRTMCSTWMLWLSIWFEDKMSPKFSSSTGHVGLPLLYSSKAFLLFLLVSNFEFPSKSEALLNYNIKASPF